MLKSYRSETDFIGDLIPHSISQLTSGNGNTLNVKRTINIVHFVDLFFVQQTLSLPKGKLVAALFCIAKLKNNENGTSNSMRIFMKINL